MKKMSKIVLLVAMVLSVSIISFAQDEKPNKTPQWVSDKGYWQLESNVKTPKHSIIYFFTNDGTLIYKENIDGMRIKLKKKRVLICLKNVLDQTITAWEKKRVLRENDMLIAVALRN